MFFADFDLFQMSLPKFRIGRRLGSHSPNSKIVVNLDSCDLTFYLNSVLVSEWRGVLKGPCAAYASIKHNGPSATLLPWFGEDCVQTDDAVDR